MRKGIAFPLFVIVGLILAVAICISGAIYLLSSGLLAQRLAEGDIVAMPIFAFLIFIVSFICYLLAMIIREVKR